MDFTGWQTRLGTWDETIVSDVVDTNEYGLPDSFTSDDVVIDVGGHIGGFSYAAWSRGARHIHAFEPEPSNFECYRHNLRAQIEAGEVNVECRAVYDKTGDSLWPAYPNTYNTGGVRFIGKDTGKVPATTVALDDILTSIGRRVRFLKLDCEGAEFPILLNATLLDKVDEISLEWHEYAGEGHSDTLHERLKSLGYEIVKFMRHPDGTIGRLQARRVNYVVVPSRNTLWMLRDAALSALAQDIGNVRVLVVNDGSTDGTVQWVASQAPDQVQMVSYYPRVASVAYAWNRALEYVFNQLGAQHALVINSDVVLRKETYRLLAEDTRDFVTGVGVHPPEWEKQKDAPLALTATPHPAFSCFLLRRRVWEIVGRFDEAFLRAYHEDGDMHLRIHHAGLSSGSLGVPFLHYASATVGEMSAQERTEVAQQADRNRDYFKQKWGFYMGTPEYYAAFGHSAPKSE